MAHVVERCLAITGRRFRERGRKLRHSGSVRSTLVAADRARILANCGELVISCGGSLPARSPRAYSAALIGIDHIPLAVDSLELASEDYRKLGFALKPGRHHDNGIHNAHVKFPDGSRIELITASQATDALTAHYRELLARGEGPAYLGFHARNTDQLLSALAAGGINYK